MAQSHLLPEPDVVQRREHRSRREDAEAVLEVVVTSSNSSSASHYEMIVVDVGVEKSFVTLSCHMFGYEGSHYS